jgi:bifunctional DNA-binding transcriptional regulator/antitoxin component of YhaV-PrlF toxin-antitoxin module
MSDTLAVQVGDEGRIVVPAPLRTRHQWSAGTPLVAIDTEVGVLFADRSTVEAMLRRQLAGADLVGELLADRRHEAASDQ